MNKERITKILQDHVDRWEARRERINKVRATYTEEYWSHHAQPLPDDDQDVKVLVSNSILRKHVESILASLFHQGFSSRPMLSRIPGAGDPIAPDHRVRVEESMGHLLDAILNENAVDVITDNVFVMGLLYFSAGLRLELDPFLTSRHPVDALNITPVPGWEIVVDPTERRPGKRRYIGHYHQVDADEAKARGWSFTKSDLQASWEWTLHGFSSSSHFEDKHKLRVLELWDLVERKYQCFIVEGYSGLKPVSGAKGMVFDGPGGVAMAPIEQVVMAPLPEAPGDGSLAMMSQYELNVERNWVVTMAANSVRRDMQRMLLAPSGALNDQAKAIFRSGRDVPLVEIENHPENRALKDAIAWVTAPSNSQSLGFMMDLLRTEAGDSQAVANTQMGRGQDYATATEILNLTRYSESVLGILARRMARHMTRFALRMILLMRDSEQVAKPIRVIAPSQGSEASQIVNLSAKQLSYRWSVQLSDATQTPLGKSQRRQEFMESMPTYLQLLQIASSPEEAPPALEGQPGVPPTAPEARLAAQRMLDKLVELYNMGDELKWARLQDFAAAEEDPTLEALLGEELSPEQQLMMALGGGGAPPALAGPPPVLGGEVVEGSIAPEDADLIPREVI